jgi:hypothetical protein
VTVPYIIFNVAPTLKYLSIPNQTPSTNRNINMDSLPPQPHHRHAAAPLQQPPLQQPPPPPPLPPQIGEKSDLLARVSEFLPRMNAANALLSNNAAAAVDHEVAILDGGLQIVDDTDEISTSSSDSDDDDDDDDEAEENSNVGTSKDDKQEGPCELDSGSETGEFDRPLKQAKLTKQRHRQTTVVLSLQLTPENNPLFQALHQDNDACVSGCSGDDDNAVPIHCDVDDSPVTEEHAPNAPQQQQPSGGSGDGKTASIQRLLAVLPAGIQTKPAAAAAVSLKPRGPLITEL